MALNLDALQLYTGNLGSIDEEPRRPLQGCSKYIESVGGKLHGFWYAFGACDGYTIWEATDNVSMAAVAIAISGGRRVVEIQDDASAHSRGDPGRPWSCEGGRLPVARSVAVQHRRS